MPELTVDGSRSVAAAADAAHAASKAPNSFDIVLATLDDAKAEDVISIDLDGKSSIGDVMVVASGRSHRHVGSIADKVTKALKEAGAGNPRVEGLPHCDWVLIDTGDVIVHIFRPEVRDFYNLERMWSADRPADPLAI